MTTASLRVRATYLVRADAGAIEARAEALLLEQTVELPRTALRDPTARERVLGDVERIEPHDPGRYRVLIAQPLATTALDPAQLLNVVFGNSSLWPDVVLDDVDLPVPPTIGCLSRSAAALHSTGGRPRAGCSARPTPPPRRTSPARG